MEGLNEATNQNSPMLFDGSGSLVCHELFNPTVLYLTCVIASMGACCVVRTVLNFQSIPKDLTCKYPAQDSKIGKD